MWTSRGGIGVCVFVVIIVGGVRICIWAAALIVVVVVELHLQLGANDTRTPKNCRSHSR